MGRMSDLKSIILFILLITIQLQNYILNICEQSTWSKYVLGVVSQNWTHNPHANCLGHYALDYQGTIVEY